MREVYRCINVEKLTGKILSIVREDKETKEDDNIPGNILREDEYVKVLIIDKNTTSDYLKDKYVVDNELVIRPSFYLQDSYHIPADGETILNVNNLPDKTEVMYKWKTYQLEDNTFQFKTDIQGEHKFIFKNFPYLDKEVIINAD